MLNLLFIVIAYLFGSISWSLVIGKVFFHTDIRTQGSGNLGGTNAGRVLGKKVGMIVIVLDALKAFFAIMIAVLIAPADTVVLPFVGIASVIGHCYPIFAGFKGGKGVATCFGFVLALGVFVVNDLLWIFVIPLLIFLATLYLTKYVSLSSMVAIFFMPLFALFKGYSMEIVLSLVILWLLVVYRHRENIKRIKDGSERKITWM